MIAKKVLKLVLILLLAGIVFAVGFWLVVSIRNYNGSCDTGDLFTSHTTYQCDLREYLTIESFWLVLSMIVVGLYWIPGTFVVALIYGFYLSYKQNQEKPITQRHYPLYTTLGIIAGLVAIFALNAFSVFRSSGQYPINSPWRIPVYIITFAILLIAGILIDRKKKKLSA